MNYFENNPVLLIFLGSFLTFLATILVETIKWWIGRNERKKNFILLSTQQLGAISKGLEKLKTVLEYKNYFDYTVLGILEKGAGELEGYKKDSIYLKSEKSKEEFIDLITDISFYLQDVRGLQNFYYEQQKDLGTPTSLFQTQLDLGRHFNEQKGLKMTDLIELKRRIQDFCREVK